MRAQDKAPQIERTTAEDVMDWLGSVEATEDDSALQTVTATQDVGFDWLAEPVIAEANENLVSALPPNLPEEADSPSWLGVEQSTSAPPAPALAQAEPLFPASELPSWLSAFTEGDDDAPSTLPEMVAQADGLIDNSLTEGVGQSTSDAPAAFDFNYDFEDIRPAWMRDTKNYTPRWMRGG
jgi:hypothetical protein